MDTFSFSLPFISLLTLIPYFLCASDLSFSDVSPHWVNLPLHCLFSQFLHILSELTFPSFFFLSTITFKYFPYPIIWVNLLLLSLSVLRRTNSVSFSKKTENPFVISVNHNYLLISFIPTVTNLLPSYPEWAHLSYFLSLIPASRQAPVCSCHFHLCNALHLRDLEEFFSSCSEPVQCPFSHCLHLLYI